MSDAPSELLGAIRDLKKSIDQLVRQDVYQADQRARDREVAQVVKDVEDLEKRLGEQARERRADKRVMYAALAAAIASPLLNLLARSPGVS